MTSMPEGAPPGRRVLARVVQEFGRPRGAAGHLAGWIMAHRRSNRERNRWVVSLLDVRPTDRVLEIGFGPGLAVAELARRAPQGHVYGIDHSAVMVRQAARRNAAAISAGRVELLHAPVERLPRLAGPLDAVVAVNSVGFWPDPVGRLGTLRGLLRPGGRIALASQPRCPGATADTTARAGGELHDLLTRAGFTPTRTEFLGLTPPVVCVLATAPPAAAGPPDARAADAIRGQDREAAVRAAYDTVAGDYDDNGLDDVSRKPLDRALLDAFVDLVGDGTIADVGCGPGRITRFLAERHRDVIGIDLSTNMIALARRRAPDLPFAVGSLVQLPAPDQAWSGVVASYSIIHLDEEQRAAAVHEFARVLSPGGWLLVAFHIDSPQFAAGDTHHLTTWFDRDVELDGYFLDPADVRSLLLGAGFRIEAELLRGPGDVVEYPSRRGYLLARRAREDRSRGDAAAVRPAHPR